MRVELHDLSFGYAGVEVLRGLRGVAEAGQITVVVGPNAAGKSTLLRCVIGALRPSQGRVAVDADDVSRLRGKVLARRVAYLPQRWDVAAAFSVSEVIALGQYALPPGGERVRVVVDMLELGAIVDRPFHALSAGQQQRVVLARALAQLQPDGCLVLDEPTSAMDLSHAARTLSILRGLAREGATIIVSLHDLPAAAAIADHVWLLEPGSGGEPPSGAIGGAADDVMQPERLERVFGVPFAWLTHPSGERVLGPDPMAPPGASR